MTRNTYNWPGQIERARRLPGRWVLAYADVPLRTAKSVRLRRHADLIRADGKLDAIMRNPYTDPYTLEQKGDLYVMWVPAS